MKLVESHFILKKKLKNMIDSNNFQTEQTFAKTIVIWKML